MAAEHSNVKIAIWKRSDTLGSDNSDAFKEGESFFADKPLVIIIL